MELTISDLARAVGRSETYVRQHVHRKHLIVRRDGRNVYVSLDEATRWARERGLPLEMLPRTSATPGAMTGRTARMTVLAWKGPDAELRNIFTLVRHRRTDSLGPWAPEPDESWSCEELEDDLRLYTFNASLERCQDFVDQVLNLGTLKIKELDVSYSLEPIPRCHWAYRDHRPDTEASVVSPFSRYSAEITEYWSFAAEPRKRWVSAKESNRLSSLGFPIDGRPDRVGNLMIAGAQDAIACDLNSHRDYSLGFTVEANGPLSEVYHATVWATHSGDDVLRRVFPIILGQTIINVGSDIDHVGFAVYRSSDGQCIDLMEQFFIMEVNINMNFESGQTISIRDRKGRLMHTIQPRGIRSNVNVESDKNEAELDKNIRRCRIESRLEKQEKEARSDGNIVRFRPAEFNKAARYFISLLRDTDEDAVIYLADRYFMNHAHGSTVADLYVDMFANTTGRQLRILCAQKEISEESPWWSSYPGVLTNHVSVRAFVKHGSNDPGFHDRYLITPDREIIITNSFNGWLKHGVTLVRIRYGVYRAEADLLWSMPLGSDASPLLVREIA